MLYTYVFTKQMRGIDTLHGHLETQKAEQHVTVRLLYVYVVGAVGFEPTASCSQGRRANQAALRPDYIKKVRLEIETCCKLAPRDGLEPPTRWLTATCSTN